MMTGQLPDEFLHAVPVIEQIEDAGFSAYFVGGSVRDFLLGAKIHDVDIATSAFPEEIKKIFPRTVDVGIEHGTVLVLSGGYQYEITTFRTESAYQDFRRPDSVTFVRTLAEDLKRRDFTMNALAMTKEGQIIDLFNGMQAISDKRIEAVGDAGERFHEDALRMLRGLRFASQLDFTLSESTLSAIYEHHKLLEKISVERINVEFVKMMQGINRHAGLLPFIASGCYRYCPDLADKSVQLLTLAGMQGPPIDSEELVWLLVCHVLEVKEVKQFLRHWKTSNKMMQQVDQALSALQFRLANDWTNSWLYRSGADNITLVESALTYCGKTGDAAGALSRYAALPIKKVQDLAVAGSDIMSATGKRGGPWLGKCIKELEQRVLTFQLENTYDALIDYATTRMEGEK